MGVEELFQKHALLESDIGIVGERIKVINKQAEKFTSPDGPDGSGECLFCSLWLLLVLQANAYYYYYSHCCFYNRRCHCCCHYYPCLFSRLQTSGSSFS